MSSVFRGVHETTGLVVAVKILSRSLAKNTVMLQRFLREAKSAEALEHPAIVSIYDRGIDQGRHYLVLEYVPGGDLQDRVRDGGPLSVEDSVGVLLQASEGLEYAARRGMIHRDIKPANLMMTPEGVVKVTDLGLALQLEAEDERVTRDGTTVGTVDYMAPEQARNSRATSVRSDIYSLGCTFHFLVSGRPPFHGGGIPEKLQRHFTESAPDIRTVCPQAPSALAHLIAQMMEKRPERRPADYGELIARLRQTLLLEPEPESRSDLPAFDLERSDFEPPVALFDDSDSEDFELGPTSAVDPLVSTCEGEPGLVAIVDDDLERTPPFDPDSLRALISDPSLELQPLDGVEEIRGRPPDDPRKPAGTLLTFDETSDSNEVETISGEGREADIDPFDKGAAPASPILLGRVRPRTLAIGGGFALLAATLGLLLLSNREAEVVQISEDSEGRDLSPVVAVSDLIPSPDQWPDVGPTGKRPDRDRTSTADEVPDRKPDRNDLVPDSAPESKPPPRPPERLARFVPDWARSPVPDRVEGPMVQALRFPALVDETHKRGLRRAFEVIGGTVEIADEGPFFEDDLRISGRDRLVRSAPGFRPILRIDPPRLAYLKSKSAICQLDGSRLILDGLDLVVDVSDLEPDQTAMFGVRESDLILHNCSITVVNWSARPFVLFDAQAGDRRSRIRIEGSLIRAESSRVFDLRRGPTDLVVRESVLLGDDLEVATVALGHPDGPQRLTLVDSLVISPGPIFNLTAPLTTSTTASAPDLRALGTTFLRPSGGGSSGFLHRSADTQGNPNESISWVGEENRFIGWDDWMTAGYSNRVLAHRLEDVRATWPGTDGESRESTSSWRLPDDFPWILPDQLATIDWPTPRDRRLLGEVAEPGPYLFEKTMAWFDRLPIEPENGAAEGDEADPIVLNFGGRDKDGDGDLGRFLRERLPGLDPGRSVRVRANGSGRLPMTPVRLPPGLKIAIEVHSEGSVPPSWWAVEGADETALIEARGGELSLEGLRLGLDGDHSGPTTIIRMEGGRLRIDHCRLESKHGANSAEGPLLDLRGPEDDSSPLSEINLIDSVFLGAGEAISLSFGRGVVRCEDCAIASGSDAISLRPRIEGTRGLVADLGLEHCTILAGRSILRLRPPECDPTRIERPWIVTSRAGAYLIVSPQGQAGPVLLADPTAGAHGLVFWQGKGDAFGAEQFASTEIPPLQPLLAPSLRQDWIDLWGRVHVLDSIGPTLGGSKAGIRLHASRHDPGSVDLIDLVIDPASLPKRNPHDFGANLGRLLGELGLGRSGDGWGRRSRDD